MSDKLKWCLHSQHKEIQTFPTTILWCKSCGSYSTDLGHIYHPPFSVVRKYARCEKCQEPKKTWNYIENCKCPS